MNVRFQQRIDSICSSVRRRRVFVALTIVLLASPSLSSSESEDEPESRNSRTSLHPSKRLNGKDTTGAFSDANDAAERWTVRIFVEERPAALGAILSSDGFIVTKLSELDNDSIEAEWKGKKFRAFRIGTNRENDIAVLKINGATGLTPVEWSASDKLKRADWVASTNRRNNGVVVGVIGADNRAIQRSGGVLGVTLEPVAEKSGGVKIKDIAALGAAKKAGIRVGDVIVAIAGKDIGSRAALQQLITQHDAGERVSVRVQRRDKKLEFEVTLGHRSVVFPQFQSRNQKMSGETSRRKAGFKEVIHHDSPLEPTAMGGPLLSLDGKALGLNIARANRVSTYALRGELVQTLTDAIIKQANPSIWLDPGAVTTAGNLPVPGMVKKDGFKAMEY